MPVFIYRNPKTGRLKEVVQKMTDVHEFTKDGVKYERVWLRPRMSVDTKVDPFSKEDFLRRTNKRMTVGDMMDESTQLSEKRVRSAGKDPLKQKVFDKYKAKTGKNHPEDHPKKIETDQFVIEL